MRIQICNLGSISRAEIDLKPLTVLIGPNNMGKTWLAYVLFGILGLRGCDEYAQAYARDQLTKSYPLLDEAIKNVLAEGNAAIDLYTFVEKYGETYFQNVTEYAKNWMNDWFATQLADFNTLKVLINVAEIKADLLGRVEKYSTLVRMANGLFTIRKERGARLLYAFTSIESDEQLSEKLPVEEIKYRLVRSTFRAIHRLIYRNVRFFPTERTTLVTLPLGSRASRNPSPSSGQKALVEALEKALQEIQESGEQISGTLIERNTRAAIGPVSSFMSMMSAIFRIGSKQVEDRKAEAKEDPNIQKYIDLADILEKEILEGELGLSTVEPDPKRDILFQATPDTTLEIPIVSSMVKELAPIVLYLRYLALPSELLVIDEPEMNLHPAAQAKLIELLAMLVNAGLDVFVTTHSSYMIDHLVNLMEAYKHRNQDEIVDKFLLEQKEAFISQEKVSVYLVVGGEVKNILDPEGIIDWKTFSDVTKLVERIHFELLGE